MNNTFDSINVDMLKEEVYQHVKDFISSKNFSVREEDFQKPWGGYFRMEDKDLNSFIDAFFPEFIGLKNSKQQMSPKILVVAPRARLSWQYHFRRAELWKVLFGPIKVMQNKTDDQNEPQKYKTDALVELDQGTRHRLIGDENWGVVAEIWKHTDPTNPSEEADIVRVQDDYGR